MNAEQKLKELGITLPEVPASVANYVPFVVTGNLLYLSGQGPLYPDGHVSLGKVGGEVSVEQAYADARQTGLNLLAAAKAALGDLDRIVRCVKVFGMVNAVPEFTGHPKVINGFSDLMVEVFGDKGRHARSAVGMGSLPNGQTVEIEVIFEISDRR